MSDNDFENYFGDIIPEGGLGTVGIRLVQYLGSDGETHWQYDLSGDGLISQIVSLLEFAKIDFMTQYLRLRDETE